MTVEERREIFAVENRDHIWEDRQEKYRRNVKVLQRYLQGWSVIDLAAREGITRQRVYQILKGFKKKRR